MANRKKQPARFRKESPARYRDPEWAVHLRLWTRSQTAANKGFFLKEHTVRRQRAAGRRTPATFQLFQKQTKPCKQTTHGRRAAMLTAPAVRNDDVSKCSEVRNESRARARC